MRGAIPPYPQYVFMAWCSVRHRDKFTSIIIIIIIIIFRTLFNGAGYIVILVGKPEETRPLGGKNRGIIPKWIL
jgi:hypothetical protein